MASGGNEIVEISKPDYSAVIKFLYLKGMTGADIDEDIKTIYGNMCLFLRTITIWKRQLKGVPMNM